MQTLKGAALEGSGPGLVRVVGSFTTNSTGGILNQRPSKSNCTITRKAAGIYVVQYAQPAQSIATSEAQIVYASNIVGSGSVAVGETVGSVYISGDFMSSDGTNFKSDSTNQNFLILVYNGSNALSDVYSLGSTSSVANYRISFEVVLCTSTMNS